VEAAPSPGGALVVIRFAAAPRVRSVALVGEGLPERGRLRDAIGLDAGDTWSGDLADAIEETLKQRLGARGLFEATVTTDVTGAESEDAVDVRVEVRPGRRALVGSPDLSGRLDEALRADLEKTTRPKPGTEWRLGRARSEADRLASTCGRWAIPGGRYEGVIRPGVEHGAREVPRSSAPGRARVVGAPGRTSEAPVLAVGPGELTDEEAVWRFRSAPSSPIRSGVRAGAVTHGRAADEDVVTFTIDRARRPSAASASSAFGAGFRGPEGGRHHDAGPGRRGRLVDRGSADADAICLYRAKD
jgi:hypothetical protein